MAYILTPGAGPARTTSPPCACSARAERVHGRLRPFCIRPSLGAGTSATFGPDAVRTGGSFALTDKQVRAVLAAALQGHPKGEEIYFFLHHDAGGGAGTFLVGPPHLYPGGKDTARFTVSDGWREAGRLTQAARAAGGAASTRFIPVGYGHTHPSGSGKPSPRDLATLAAFLRDQEVVGMVIGEGGMPSPEKVKDRLARGRRVPQKRKILDASVVWRDAYPRGMTATPPLAVPAGVLRSHRDAAAAVHALSAALRFRYFEGQLVYERGAFSGSFSEVR